MKTVDGRTQEPMERVVISVSEAMSGTIISLMAERKGMLSDMITHHGQTTLQFDAPTR